VATWEARRFDWCCALGAGLEISVSYEGAERVPEGEPRYNVYVFGRRMTIRSADVETGKMRAESAAKKWLTEALAKLN